LRGGSSEKSKTSTQRRKERKGRKRKVSSTGHSAQSAYLVLATARSFLRPFASFALSR
jgi:transketolase N-terminal domain/subunit